MTIREDEPLCRHTTLRTGGPARYYMEAASEADIKAALMHARTLGQPIFILGGGSNVLAADEGVQGIVLKIGSKGIDVEDVSTEQVEVKAEAGEEWDSLVAFTVERGLFGLENLSLIPGTVGGAVAGNIGAYGAEVAQRLSWVDTLDIRTLAERRLSAAECALAYRTSFFKSPPGRHHVIARAGFLLERRGRCNTRYKDLNTHFAALKLDSPTPAEVRKAVVAIRRRKLPDPALIGTAGSFFKNPVLSKAHYDALARRYEGLPGHEEPDGRVKVPLGWVMDKICGLRGWRQGPVGTHPEQALVLVNEGGTSAQIEAFALETARRIWEATGIEVEWEVARLG